MIVVLTFVQNVFTEKEIAMDASLLRKWIVGFIGAFFLNEAGCGELDAKSK
jgi:hypothetical protein